MTPCCDKMAQAENTRDGFLESSLDLRGEPYQEAKVYILGSALAELRIWGDTGYESGATIIQFCPWCGIKIRGD